MYWNQSRFINAQGVRWRSGRREYVGISCCSTARGGILTLECLEGSTGTHTFCASYQDNFKIVYHVSTLLPFHEDDKQRVERKRHLGNDVVNVIFVDSYSQTFNPESIKTNFIRTCGSGSASSCCSCVRF